MSRVNCRCTVLPDVVAEVADSGGDRVSAAYRAGRAVLAVTGALALAGFIGWHVLVWRMGEVYRWDNTKGQGNA